MLENLRSSPAKIAFCFGAGVIVLLVLLNKSGTVAKGNIQPVKMAKPEELRRVGGLGALREKDPEVQEAVNKILPQLSSKSGKDFASVDVISYRHQTVAGKNYFVKGVAKTKSGQEEIVHLRVYQPLGDREPELSQYQLSKTKEDEIVYFQ